GAGHLAAFSVVYPGERRRSQRSRSRHQAGRRKSPGDSRGTCETQLGESMSIKRFAPALLAGLTALALVLTTSQAQPVPTTTFLETFDSDAAAPLPYRPPGWDVSVVSHADDTIETMWANHGPNCEAPDNQWPAGTAPSPSTNHLIHLASEAV